MGIAIKVAIFVLMVSSLISAEQCYFIPPNGWNLADPTKIPPHSKVQICFLGPSSKPLLPSVNLAIEEVKDVSLKAYLDIVKKDCEKDPNSKWRDLGKYKTNFGEGRLTEREVQTELGTCRQVQLIVLKDNKFYILTAAALKEEFSKHYKDFEAALGSLKITEDLSACLSEEKRVQLQKLIGDLKKTGWESFQAKIINDFTEIGPYWQILILKELQGKI